MQIDFHHAVTYVLARLAGFSADDAEIIGHASQYVDDATNEGIVKFTNGAMYRRISSAHQVIDLQNIDDVINHRVWVPFHFLPGNGGLEAGESPGGGFINKLVCTPDSFVAEEMLACCIADSRKPYALHRLGITIHVLSDTFAHQGFAGVIHDINDISELDYDGGAESHSIFKEFFDRMKISLIDATLPLGHGAALACPDLPYLKWRYANRLNQSFARDNTAIFMAAVQSIYNSLKKYRDNTAGRIVTGQISIQDMERIKRNFSEFTDEKGDARHRRWAGSIAAGDFSFGSEEISYIPKGRGSWKYQALNTEHDHDISKYIYSERFLRSNWKMFHDALQKHQFEVIHDILPRYGICVS
ncbi:MAG: DUF6765 family protein [Bacteroidota bacterium]